MQNEVSEHLAKALRQVRVSSPSMENRLEKTDTTGSERSNGCTPFDKQDAEGPPNSDVLASIRDQLVECFDIGFNLLARIEEAGQGMDASLGLETWNMAEYLVGRIIQVAKPQPQVLMDVAINLERHPRYLSKFIHTCLLSINTGIGLGYSPDRLLHLGISALLHDIGLFELPKAILQGDQKLTNREFEMMKQHTIIGVQRLRQLLGDRVNNDILAGIYQHHEQIDGQGYPEQKTEKGIHEFAQIIGIANAYEAITHKKHKTPHEALREIIRLGGKSYSRKITRTFVNQVAIFPVGSLVTLTNGEIAKVISSNKDYPLRPVVLTLVDRSRHKVKASAVLDLCQTMTLSVNSNKPIKPEDIGIDRKDILYATGSLENQYHEPVYIPDDLGTRIWENAEGSENRKDSGGFREDNRSDVEMASSHPDKQQSERIQTADVNRLEVESQEPIVSSQEGVTFSYSGERDLDASIDRAGVAHTGEVNTMASDVYSDFPEISEVDEEDALYQLAEQQLRSMLFSWPQGKPIPEIYLRAQVKKLKDAKRN